MTYHQHSSYLSCWTSSQIDIPSIQFDRQSLQSIILGQWFSVGKTIPSDWIYAVSLLCTEWKYSEWLTALPIWVEHTAPTTKCTFDLKVYKCDWRQYYFIFKHMIAICQMINNPVWPKGKMFCIAKDHLFLLWISMH